MSAVRFASLAALLRNADFPESFARRADAAAADEERHADLCRTAAGHFDVTDVPILPDIVPARLANPRHAATREAVAFCAISETLNATLLAVTLRHATDTALRDLVRSLLADEVDHSRLGWAVLEEERRHSDVAWLSAPLVPLLRGAVSEELLASSGDEGDPEATALGLLPGRVRLDLLAATLEDVVFPGLTRAGIDVASAQTWARATLGRAAA